PTFNELYYPDYGNPDLDAETSRSLEVGLSGTHGWGHWAVNAFRTNVDDLIGNDPRPAPGRPWGQPNNIDEARIRGVELVLGSQWLGWDWNANATFLDPQNRSGGVNDGNELPRRARRMFNLELDRRFERLSLGASVHAEGRRYDDPANKVRLGGYATLDLRSEYRLNDEWRLQGRIANLFGANYETAYGYNQPGQAVYLSVRYQAL
ncbi:TonB-dependent receptor domain-containing protein, partial [Pseudomonas aeruginosa]